MVNSSILSREPPLLEAVYLVNLLFIFVLFLLLFVVAADLANVYYMTFHEYIFRVSLLKPLYFFVFLGFI